ncbi:MAG: carboxylesterase family protein [Pseudohongiellaceae bacterium]
MNSQHHVLIAATVLSLSLVTACSPRTEQEAVEAVTESGVNPTLRTIEQGQLVGLVQDNGSHSWKGIPYAQPPVGELRWKLPQPVALWDDVFQATETIQPCTQFASGLTAGIPDPDGDGIVGSENCLYLSVFAPDGASSGEPLPVMYWIFGGGNNSGYAGDYNGGALAQSQNVIVVTVNYRLGSLGWFLHPAILEEGASGAAGGGNWSTVDTIAGLEWVRDNISAFGGDSGNVTIFGESAGGSNVMSLVTSPLAEGLFHRAVVQSGGVGTTTIEQGENFLDDEVPGHFHSSREIINKILVRDGRAVDREEAKAMQLAMSNEEINTLLYSQDPAEFLRLYNPEGSRNYPAPKKFRDGAVFVAEPPLEQLANGNYNQVPIILGTNRDERRIYMYGQWTDVIRNDPDEYVRAAAYPSDMRKLTGVDNLARIMAPVQNSGVYAFRFDWDEQKTTEDGLDMAIAVGAAHSTEMAFVFGDWSVGFLPGERLYDPQTNPGRDRLSEAMMSYWANFAYTGDPGQGRQGNLPEWQQWRNGDGNSKMIILDSERDGGIRMSDEEVTLESIKADFLRAEFSSHQNRCDTYRETFAGTTAFEPGEYATLGENGCSED